MRNTCTLQYNITYIHHHVIVWPFFFFLKQCTEATEWKQFSTTLLLGGPALFLAQQNEAWFLSRTAPAPRAITGSGCGVGDTFPESSAQRTRSGSLGRWPPRCSYFVLVSGMFFSCSWGALLIRWLEEGGQGAMTKDISWGERWGRPELVCTEQGSWSVL